MDSACRLPRENVSSLARGLTRYRVLLFLLLAAALPLFFGNLRGSGFLDNEGRYAEVAREMLLTGDWLTPHMNGEVFLNKPPLMFWLTALAFQLLGAGEGARMISGLATLAALGLLYAIGSRLWNARAGFWSAAVFLTMSLTPVEARSLRPDALLACLLCLTLWGALRLWEIPGQPAGLAALWGGIGLGVMTKGLLGLVLPVLVLAPALWFSGGLGRARRLCPWQGLLLAAALILPWHVAAGLANEGFWWDYVINQHLLVFFDRKFPRDHIPHPLWFSWTVFTIRLFPWVVLLAPAFVAQLRRARSSGEFADWLPVTWFGAIAVFFSFAMGRLEHHFIPAVPGAALLIGGYCAHRLEAAAPEVMPGSRWFWALGAGLLILGVGGWLAVGPATAGRLPETQLAPLRETAYVTMAMLAVGGAVALGSLSGRRPGLALGAVAGTFFCFGFCAIRGMEAVEPMLCARPLIRSLDPKLVETSAIAYEAGEEYQQCGVIDFYLNTKVVLLEPPGFIPPTYLQRDVRRLFTKRETFWDEWAEGKRRYLLFSDPQKPLDRPDEFPQPHFEVARGGGRVVLTNLPLPVRAANRLFGLAPQKRGAVTRVDVAGRALP